jgi:hypothetical protein
MNPVHAKPRAFHWSLSWARSIQSTPRQESSTGPYPEPDQSSPHTKSPILVPILTQTNPVHTTPRALHWPLFWASSIPSTHQELSTGPYPEPDQFISYHPKTPLPLLPVLSHFNPVHVPLGTSIYFTNDHQHARALPVQWQLDIPYFTHSGWLLVWTATFNPTTATYDYSYVQCYTGFIVPGT